MTENQQYMNNDFFDSNSSNNSGRYQNMDSLRDNPILTTASMPIPTRGRIAADFSDFGLMLEPSNSPHLFHDLSSSSGLGNDSGVYGLQQQSGSITNSNTMWSDIGAAMVSPKTEPFQMDDDDIFQVDKADLIQGPTLAELNDETLLGDLNIEDIILPDETAYLLANHPALHQFHTSNSNLLSTSSVPPQQLLQIQVQQQQQNSNSMHSPGISIGNEVLYDEQSTLGSPSPGSFEFYHSTPTKSINSNAAFSPGSHHSSNSSLLINSATPPQNSNNYLQQSPQQYQSTLHTLLKKEYTMPMLGQSVPAGQSSMIIAGQALSPGGFNNRRLLHNFHGGGGSGSNSGANGNNAQASTSRLSSSAPTHLGLDQIWQRREPRQHLLSTGSLAEAGSTSSLSTGGVLSPEAQDFSHDEGYSEDDDSDHYEDYSTDGDSDGDENHKHMSNSKKERFFWQYNVQAKGPKGQRLVIKKQLEDPHVLNEITDPVFSPHCSVRGIKHSGKARKGDGNDLTPNPRKLHSIGKELDKLGRVINDMTPVSELPFNVRPKTRKEKNKLASRACRLKKKAQHEANKIKLQGLEAEHKRLLSGIAQIKQIIAMKCTKQVGENKDEINQQIDKIVKSATKIKIAGSSTEFVNKILDKVKSGVPSGGLQEEI